MDVLEELLAEVDPRTEVLPEPAPVPPPCSCHGKPRWSCPTFISHHVELVARVVESGVPNMDGLRLELTDRCVDPAPWEKLLVGYFDQETLVDKFDAV